VGFQGRRQHRFQEDQRGLRPMDGMSTDSIMTIVGETSTPRQMLSGSRRMPIYRHVMLDSLRRSSPWWRLSRAPTAQQSYVQRLVPAGPLPVVFVCRRHHYLPRTVGLSSPHDSRHMISALDKRMFVVCCQSKDRSFEEHRSW